MILDEHKSVVQDADFVDAHEQNISVSSLVHVGNGGGKIAIWYGGCGTGSGKP